VWSHITAVQLTLGFVGIDGKVFYVTAGQSFVMYIAWNRKDNLDMGASVFVVQFNGFMSLTT